MSFLRALGYWGFGVQGIRAQGLAVLLGQDPPFTLKQGHIAPLVVGIHPQGWGDCCASGKTH